MKPYLKEVPLLLRDPSCLLLQLILTMPPTIEKGNIPFTNSQNTSTF